MKITINGVELQLTPEQIAVLAKEINKPTKEERFAELIKGIDINRPVVDFEKYPTSLFWFKEDKCLIEYNWENGIILVSYESIWQLFYDEFSMEYSEVQIFIKSMVEQHFKLKGVTPVSIICMVMVLVEQHFKLKGVTPIII